MTGLRYKIAFLFAFTLLSFSCKKESNSSSPNITTQPTHNINADVRDTLTGYYVGTTQIQEEIVYYFYKDGNWADSSAFTYRYTTDTIAVSKGTAHQIDLVSKLYQTSLLDTLPFSETFKIPSQPITIEFPNKNTWNGLGEISIDSADKTKFHLHTYWEVLGHDITGGQDKKTNYFSMVTFYRK